MKKSALIIGAGVSGMVLAQKLSDEGVLVNLIEATNSLGGRCRSFKDTKTNEIIDNGQHLMMGAYNEFLNFIKRLKTEEYLTVLPNLEINFHNILGNNFKLFDNNLPGKFGFAYAISKIPLLNYKEKVNFLMFLLKIKFLNAEKISISVSQLLLDNKQSQNLIQILWTPLTLAVLNAPPNEAPASLLVKVMQKAFLSSNESSKFIFPNSSYNELFNPLIDILKYNNSNILFNTPISKIEFDNKSVSGILTKSGELLKADYYVSTTPHHQLMKILPEKILLESQMRHLHRFGSNTIVSAYLWYNEEIDLPIINAIIMSPIHWIFNRAKMQKIKLNSEFKSCITITISDANEMNEMSNLEIFDLILEELSQINDIFKTAKPVHYRILKDKRATMLINSTNEKVRLKQTTEFNNFYICGDWTDTKYPATIEGAALSADKVFRIIKNV